MRIAYRNRRYPKLEIQKFSDLQTQIQFTDKQHDIHQIKAT